MKTTRLYNILLPIWLLIWVHSPLWLILIPLNYLIDRFVLKFSLKGYENRDEFVRKNTWKVCLIGFLSDFVGCALLFITMYVLGRLGDHDIAPALNMNPFKNIWALLIIILAIIVSGLCIYLLNKTILRKSGLNNKEAIKSALYLALITAPYLFLIPSGILYQ